MQLHLLVVAVMALGAGADTVSDLCPLLGIASADACKFLAPSCKMVGTNCVADPAAPPCSIEGLPQVISKIVTDCGEADQTACGATCKAACSSEAVKALIPKITALVTQDSTKAQQQLAPCVYAAGPLTELTALITKAKWLPTLNVKALTDMATKCYSTTNPVKPPTVAPSPTPPPTIPEGIGFDLCAVASDMNFCSVMAPGCKATGATCVKDGDQVCSIADGPKLLADVINGCTAQDLASCSATCKTAVKAAEPVLADIRSRGLEPKLALAMLSSCFIKAAATMKFEQSLIQEVVAVGFGLDKLINSCGNNCKKGTYLMGSNCVACPAGQFSGASATACSNCRKGQYNSESGQESCKPCAPGTFSADDKATACNSCAAGSFVAVSGATGCTKCKAGEGSEEKANRCTACAKGMFSANEGDGCKKCSAGKIAPAESATACVDCAANMVAETEGLSVCTACKLGWSAKPGDLTCKNNGLTDLVSSAPSSSAIAASAVALLLTVRAML